MVVSVVNLLVRVFSGSYTSRKAVLTAWMLRTLKHEESENYNPLSLP